MNYSAKSHKTRTEERNRFGPFDVTFRFEITLKIKAGLNKSADFETRI